MEEAEEAHDVAESAAFERRRRRQRVAADVLDVAEAAAPRQGVGGGGDVSLELEARDGAVLRRRDAADDAAEARADLEDGAPRAQAEARRRLVDGLDAVVVHAVDGAQRARVQGAVGGEAPLDELAVEALEVVVELHGLDLHGGAHGGRNGPRVQCTGIGDCGSSW